MRVLHAFTFLSVFLLVVSCFASASPGNMTKVGESTLSTKQTARDNYSPSSNTASVEGYIQPRKPGECFSAKNCTGRRIGVHQHAHNCKNAGGKSWRSGVTGQCSNL